MTLDVRFNLVLRATVSIYYHTVDSISSEKMRKYTVDSMMLGCAK